MTWCCIEGLLADRVIETDDGVLHHCINITWGRNGALGAFFAVCDMEEKFPTYTAGGIDFEDLRKAQIRQRSTAGAGSPTCLSCVSVVHLWEDLEILAL